MVPEESEAVKRSAPRASRAEQGFLSGEKIGGPVLTGFGPALDRLWTSLV